MFLTDAVPPDGLHVGRRAISFVRGEAIHRKPRVELAHQAVAAHLRQNARRGNARHARVAIDHSLNMSRAPRSFRAGLWPFDCPEKLRQLVLLNIVFGKLRGLGPTRPLLAQSQELWRAVATINEYAVWPFWQFVHSASHRSQGRTQDIRFVDVRGLHLRNRPSGAALEARISDSLEQAFPIRLGQVLGVGDLRHELHDLGVAVSQHRERPSDDGPCQRSTARLVGAGHNCKAFAPKTSLPRLQANRRDSTVAIGGTSLGLGAEAILHSFRDFRTLRGGLAIAFSHWDRSRFGGNCFATSATTAAASPTTFFRGKVRHLRGWRGLERPGRCLRAPPWHGAGGDEERRRVTCPSPRLSPALGRCSRRLAARAALLVPTAHGCRRALA
mmetsp:Transcript_123294/g.348392  ORF Transcript_123294/g.348392 Transcript_123294/m.348392 type:complete len:386 (-) Transcript_123294:413-1570(-)